jgi:hypothetical protein
MNDIFKKVFEGMHKAAEGDKGVIDEAENKVRRFDGVPETQNTSTKKVEVSRLTEWERKKEEDEDKRFNQAA